MAAGKLLGLHLGLTSNLKMPLPTRSTPPADDDGKGVDEALESTTVEPRLEDRQHCWHLQDTRGIARPARQSSLNQASNVLDLRSARIVCSKPTELATRPLA